MSVFSKVLRAGEGKKLRRLVEVVPHINALEPELHALGDAELRGKTAEFRERYDNGEDLEDILVEAFAVVREAAQRVIGQRHFDVQLMGGMALHFGWIAEMKTGEGKTLVSTLPVYLNAITGRGVHMVTVNDYLATRDAGWMGQIHQWLGLTVGLITSDNSDHDARKAAYDADVTYGTNTEFGFDYLRDNMSRSTEWMVQRGHAYAIVDEVDSILIDEARTPLIISGPAADATRLYYQFAAIARSLQRDVDYEVEEDKRTVVPTEEGITKVERALNVENLYDNVSTNLVHQLIKSLEAKELYIRDRNYVVMEGEVKIVDEFRGRIAEGRRWEEGLHQAIEAKERVKIKEENHTWASVTLQNFFRMYEKLAGMTGTAETEASEFANTYHLPVVPIPTNLPMIRMDHPDVVFKGEDAKFAAVVADIAECQERGQPVLVGTASVAKSEHLSRLLEKEGIAHNVLNAKQHFREAEIVAQAGRLHAVTVATNMAGRGVDIILGGNPEMQARTEVLASGLDPESEEGRAELAKRTKRYEREAAAEGDRVRELGGLYVLGSERHESRRIDNQLRGRSGRQGDPGMSRFYLSMEDDLLRIFAGSAVDWVMSKTLPDDVPIEARIMTRAIEKAQNTVEGKNSEIRKDTLKYDEVMNEQRKVIYARRMQVLEGEDLQERTQELLGETVRDLVYRYCPEEFAEEWDLEGLITALAQFYPSEFATTDLSAAVDREHMAESLVAEALTYYEGRDAMFGGAEEARAVEREVMLQIIDMRWREHLAEMDYLKTGLNLRAMGQQDPLVVWQKEGFDMFGTLMRAIDEDYLRNVLHVQVIPQGVEQPDLSAARYEGGGDPAGDGAGPGGHAGTNGDRTGRAGAGGASDGRGGFRDAEPSGAGGARRGGSGKAQRRGAQQGARQGARQGSRRPAPAAEGQVVRGEHEKLGRNDPCWCGSGRKYKHCHESR